MALVRTTASSAIAASDTSIVVASAAGFAAGYLVRVDEEIMRVSTAYVSGTTIPVIRGQNGTRVLAHPVTCSVIAGIASDWSNPDPTLAVQFPIAGRARPTLSYSASGAIDLPTPGNDLLVILNSTVALAMTLANPSKDMDGSILIIVGNGSAAHTVAPAAALNNAGSNFDTAITFAAGGKQVVPLIAVNEFWCIFPSVAAGTLTNVTVTYS
jgi:hypothetical protein